MKKKLTTKQAIKKLVNIECMYALEKTKAKLEFNRNVLKLQLEIEESGLIWNDVVASNEITNLDLNFKE